MFLHSRQKQPLDHLSRDILSQSYYFSPPFKAAVSKLLCDFFLFSWDIIVYPREPIPSLP